MSDLAQLVSNMPRELQMRIIKHMDIDSRRALGIYTKLSIPSDLIRKLNAIPKIQNTENYAIAYLGDMYRLYHQLQVISLDDYDHYSYYVCHVIRSTQCVIYYGEDGLFENSPITYSLSMVY